MEDLFLSDSGERPSFDAGEYLVPGVYVVENTHQPQQAEFDPVAEWQEWAATHKADDLLDQLDDAVNDKD
ncbi:MAG: hypothetical protein ROR55_24680 [Devosia sp.]